MPYIAEAPAPFTADDLARSDRIDLSVPAHIAYLMISIGEAMGPVKRGPNPEYLDYVRLQDCLGCTAAAIAGGGRKRHAALRDYALGDTPKVQPHHIRSSGVRLKCPDEWTVPLCLRCHNALHYQGKRRFLADRGLDHYGQHAYEAAALFYAAIYVNTKAEEASELSIKRAAQAFNDLWKHHGRPL